MKWTDRQREAIETRNQNILVSAAAGSGKTAVLVERIIRLVIEEKVDIDQLLVVTFTKAAASEMKAKIVKAIKKRIKEDPENSVFLRKQLQNMYKCSISTFHSFAIDVIRKYFYIIDINPNLSVADETQTAIMKQEVMDQIFFDEFERNSKEFLSFLRGYSSYKGESNIKESILKLYERIMALPEPFQWLGEKVEILKDKEAFFGSRNYEVFSKLMEEEAKRKLADAIAYKKKIVSLCEEQFILKMKAKNQGDLDFALKAMELLEESKEEAAEFIMGFSPVRLAVTKDEKENYEVIKEEVKELNDEFKSLVREAGEILLSFADENINMLLETYPHLKTLQHLLEELHRVYSEYKLDKKIMDFNDIEHFTIEILKDEKVSAEIREKYKHIFIDEYQDSNYLQETIKIGRAHV